MKGELPPVRPFELDPRAGRFETVEETPELPAELAPPPVPPARPFWRRPGLLLVGSIIGLVLLQAIDYVTGLIETTPLLGWPFAVLLAVVVVTALPAPAAATLYVVTIVEFSSRSVMVSAETATVAFTSR